MMKLSQAATVLQGKLNGADLEFNGVSTDTRTLQPGDLFVALIGPNFDGHHFIPDATAKKAAAILAQQPIKSTLPVLQVDDTLAALGQLATHHRQQFNIPVIGITGSCGKTTTRALTASILNGWKPTLFSESSFNNNIGVPLTLLRLRAQHHYAVIEMGANHFGEIAELTKIVKPNIAIITNAAAAHLEGFGSIAGVCKAKGEIFQGLPKDGIGILNADDAHFKDWQKMVAPHTLLSFGVTKPADVYAQQITTTADGKPQFILVTPSGETSIQLPLIGRHNIANALAAAAAAYAAAIPLAAIKAGLESAAAVSKRLNIYQTPHGAEIIDDSYNANPLSVQAAIETLAERPGEKILVLGDMRELGENATELHHAIGEKALQSGIDHLYTYGELSAHATSAFGKQAQHFTDQAVLITALKTKLAPKATFLVKGSKSMHMGRVVEALLATTK